MSNRSINVSSSYISKPYSRASENECSYKKLRSVDLSRCKIQNDVYKLSYGQYGLQGYVCYLSTRD
jgi:hypothetical protein